MGFKFGGLKKGDLVKEVSIPRQNPVVALKTTLKNDFQVCILLDNKYSDPLIKSLITFLEKTIDRNYIILTATPLEFSSEDLKQVVNFYARNSISISDFIPEIFSNVVYLSVGRAIYTFTESDDLFVEGFYDYIFNQTYFYSPKVNSYVFPIDQLNVIFKNQASSWVLKDSARAKFASLQCSNLINMFPTLDKSESNIFIHTLMTPEEITKFLLDNMSYTGIIAVDTETSGLDFTESELGCITLSIDGIHGYYLPFKSIDKELMNKFLSNKKIVGHNYKFDYKVLRKNGINTNLPYGDTMVLGQTLNETRGNSLKALSYIYTKFGGYENELNALKSAYKIQNYLSIPHDVLSQYATKDAIATYQLYFAMQKQMDFLDEKYPPLEGEKTIRYSYEEIILPGYKEFCDIEYSGAFVDMNKLNATSQAIIEKIKDTKQKIYDMLSISETTLNLDSPKQLGEYIEKVLKWKDYGRNKDGSYSTGDNQLLRWVKEGHEVAKLIQKVRSYSTLLGMFVGTPDSKEGWREYLKPVNESIYVMHPSYGIAMAASKRNVCKDPNLQQVPSRGEFSDEIKGTLSVPPKDEEGDYVFGTLDYASLQIRLCALDSNDSFLCNLYKTDADPDLHSTTGYELVRDTSYKFVKVELDIGEIKEFYENEYISVKRDGKEISILAKELKDTDEIL